MKLLVACFIAGHFFIYSVGILWEETDSIYKWVDYLRVCRNAIHPFKKRDYGTPKDFLDGVNRLDELIRLIDSRLPDLAYYFRLSVMQKRKLLL